MNIHYIEKNESELWNAFVANAPHGTILQSYEWGTVKSNSWEPIYLSVKDLDGKLQLTALVLKRTIPFSNRTVLYCPRGPVFQGFAPAVWTVFFTELEALAKRMRAVAFRCDPEIREGDEIGAQFESWGLQYNAENIQPRATIILDISRNEQDLLQGFHRKTRYNIKLSARKGVTVRELNSSAGVDIFYSLFRSTSKRNKFMILQEQYFKHLWQSLSEVGKCTIFVAFVDEKPLAAILQTVFGNRMTYLYGASSNEHRNLMPNHLIHWEAIKWAKAHGLTEYDMWGIPSNPAENHPLWGVYRFKTGFQEEEIRWMGTYIKIFRRLDYLVFEKGVRVARALIRLIKTGKLKSSLDE